jgi:hypothetical protein
MQATELRERGIYTRSDQKEFVVCASGDGSGYWLYSQVAWQQRRLPEYRAQVSGRVLSKGLVTPWRLEDLKDTGRTADRGCGLITHSTRDRCSFDSNLRSKLS